MPRWSNSCWLGDLDSKSGVQLYMSVRQKGSKDDPSIMLSPDLKVGSASRLISEPADQVGLILSEGFQLGDDIMLVEVFILNVRERWLFAGNGLYKVKQSSFDINVLISSRKRVIRDGIMI